MERNTAAVWRAVDRCGAGGLEEKGVSLLVVATSSWREQIRPLIDEKY